MCSALFDARTVSKIAKRDAPGTLISPTEIYNLATSPARVGERLALDCIMSQVCFTTACRWKNDLFRKDDGVHSGAWFEMMLYEWLQRIPNAAIRTSPNINGVSPDFLVETSDGKILVEAFFSCEKVDQRRVDGLQRRLFELFGKIKHDSAVCAHVICAGNRLNSEHLCTVLSQWLNNKGHSSCNYADNFGNNILFSADPSISKAIFTISGARPICQERLRKRVIEKARKYTALARTLKCPFVLATLPDYRSYILDSLFGSATKSGARHIKSVDPAGRGSSDNNLNVHNDSTRYVSGILLFNRWYDRDNKRRRVSANYISLHDAAHKLKWTDLPVCQMLVVKQGENTYREADWQEVNNDKYHAAFLQTLQH